MSVTGLVEWDRSALVLNVELCPSLDHRTPLLQVSIPHRLNQRFIAGTKAVRILCVNGRGGEETQGDPQSQAFHNRHSF